MHEKAEDRTEQNEKHKEDADVFITPIRFRKAVIVSN